MSERRKRDYSVYVYWAIVFAIVATITYCNRNKKVVIPGYEEAKEIPTTSIQHFGAGDELIFRITFSDNGTIYLRDLDSTWSGLDSRILYKDTVYESLWEIPFVSGDTATVINVTTHDNILRVTVQGSGPEGNLGKGEPERYDREPVFPAQKPKQ
jgi:hypothetical protein